MASGRRTLDDIESAISDVRARERGAQKDLEVATARRAQLIEERARAFRELAQVRAEHALADGVVDQADRLSHRVASLLRARQTTIDALKDRHGEVSQAYDERLERSKPLHDEIAKMEEELDAFAVRARAALGKEPAYGVLKTQFEGLTQMREKAGKKAAQAREDREKKGSDYENDVLFMYLWERGYRTSRYKGKGFIRWADDKVARLVGYSDARADYAVLLEIPQRLFEHVANLDKRIVATTTKIETLEAEKTGELAGPEFLSRLQEKRNVERALTEEIEAFGAQMAEIVTQLNHYAEGLDRSFQSAVEMSAGFLEQASYRQLVRLARSTNVPSDDEIVERIANIDRASATVGEEISKGRKELDKIAARREELIGIAADFRRSHYDVPGSVFVPDESVNIILEELVRGVITGAEYWARTRRRHRWNSRAADPFRRTQGFPPFGGSDFGRTMSGGGGGGGGFGTGGGF